MTAVRSRHAIRRYHRAHPPTAAPKKSCVFCAIDASSREIVARTKHFRVIHNIFPYSLWDSQEVTDHLMIVPIMHTDRLAGLPSAAAKEFVDLLSQYELDGYNVWARAAGSTMKSVEHQHTHLIKLSGKHIRGLFFIRKPYLRMLVK